MSGCGTGSVRFQSSKLFFNISFFLFEASVNIWVIISESWWSPCYSRFEWFKGFDSLGKARCGPVNLKLNSKLNLNLNDLTWPWPWSHACVVRFSLGDRFGERCAISQLEWDNWTCHERISISLNNTLFYLWQIHRWLWLCQWRFFSNGRRQGIIWIWQSTLCEWSKGYARTMTRRSRGVFRYLDYFFS